MGLNHFERLECNCFYANDRTFCNKPTEENECDNQYISQSSNNFNIKCFYKLPFQNIITQIRNEVHFFYSGQFINKCNM